MLTSLFSRTPLTLSRILGCLAAALLGGSLSAATTITYTNGQIDATGHSTSAPNDPTTLTIASGSATQSGALTGDGSVIKTGAGTLILSGLNDYSGSTTIRAGTLQVSESGTINNVDFASSLIIGDQSGDVATLLISGGSVIFNEGSVGRSAGSRGTVTMTSGTWVDNEDLFIIGGEGIGVVDFSGGRAKVGTTVLGASTGGSGTLNVSGGTWTNAFDSRFFIGGDGTGVLNLTGGTVNVGFNGGGTVTLGAQGTLNMGTGDTVGILGAGTVTSGSSTAVVNFNHSASLNFAPALAGSLKVNHIGSGTTTLTKANTYTGKTSVLGGTLELKFGTVASNILSASSSLDLGSGRLLLTGTGTQALNGLNTVGGAGSLVVGANQTLNLGALGTVALYSAVNFNTAAGGADGAMVGSGVILLSGPATDSVINSSFTVTDSTGFGLATVNGSGQIIRQTATDLLPNGSVFGGNYRIDNNGGGSAAAGSSTLIVTSFQNVDSITVDTTAGAGVLTLANNTSIYSSVWNFGGNGGHSYEITGTGGVLGTSFAGTLQINNYNTAPVTFSVPINGSNLSLRVSGPGTTILTARNTYDMGTTVTSGVLEVAAGGAIDTSSGSTTIGSEVGDHATLLISGGSVNGFSGIAFLGKTSGSSGTATISGGNWNTTLLYVGYYGAGVLNLSGSGAISGVTITLGYYAGSSGTANMSDGSWYTSSRVILGNEGIGVLNLTGGSIFNSYAALANTSGSSGTANVSGGYWSNDSNLQVGYQGTGVLNLSGGGVSSNNGTLGTMAGSSGTVNVSGTGNWSSTSSLIIGGRGTGVLNLGAGAVSNANGWLGQSAGSIGTANVRGTGMWINSSGLFVGDGGTGVLNLSGGTVDSPFTSMGYGDGSDGTANVSGGRLNSGFLTIGNLGSGVLNLTGGTVSLNGGAGTATLGALGTLNLGTGGTAGTLDAATVTSASSTALVNFNHTDSLSLAADFSGSLWINKLGSGTTVLTGILSYSGATNLNGGTFRINGDASAATGAVTVRTGATLGGSGSMGGAITVQSGGVLAPGNSIGTLTGVSSIFQSGSLFDLEGGGAFFDRLTLSSTATIQSGALISFAISSLLTESSYTLISASGGLDGSTRFTLSGDLPAGYALKYTGTDLLLQALSPDTAYWTGDASTTWSTLTAQNTNWATAQDGSTDTEALPGATSKVTFTATGATNLNIVLDVDPTIQSLTVNNTVAIGGAHTLTVTGDTLINSGVLTLNSGVTLASAESFIGSGVSDSGSVLVTGAGTQWTSTGDLNVGFAGSNNTLSIADQAVVSASDTKIGGYVGALGNAVTVTGAGAQLNNTGDLTVGYGGNSNSLTLQNGGAATNVNSFIGFRFDELSASSSNTVLVNGSGSLWTSTGVLHLGMYGDDNTLTVSAGGVVSVNGANQDALIGTNDGATGNKLTVTGSGSEFSNNATLYIGSQGDSNTLEVLAGGKVTSKNVRIGGDALASGNTATVDGAGSVWNISGTQLRVGDAGDSSTLTVENGGAVNVTTGLTVLGRQSTSDGSSVLVTGTASKLSTVNLTIGRDGTNNTVTVAAGGNVTATGSVIIAENAGSSGKLQIGSGATAGSVTATSISGGLGTATVAFDHTDDISFAPQITGSTSLTKDGAGITNLTAASTYTGTTSVNVGALALSGSLSGAGDMTVANNAMLTGGGAITTAADKSIFLNGILNVQSVGSNAAATFSVTNSGTGALVMGAGSFIAIDLFTGASSGGMGTSDTLNLHGTLNATSGGTLLLGNPNTMTSYAGGDQWKVIDLNGGDGSITGTLALNDSSLGLATGFIGSFDQTTGIYSIADRRAEITAQSSGLPMANAQSQAIIFGMQTALNDVNNHLFNLRAGGGEEEEDDDDGSISAALDYGVVTGEGDGPEDPIAKRVKRSRQWEVFTTVNYGNVNLNPISSQAGVQVDSWASSVGIERHLSRSVTLGFAATFLQSTQTYTGGLGRLDLEGPTLSAYVTYVRKGFWSSLLYSFGAYDLGSQRNPGLGLPVASGSTNAYTHAIQYNTGYNFRFQNNTLVTGPFIGIDYLHGTVDAYSETGGGVGALAYGKQSFESLVTRIGWSASKKIHTHWADITPQVRLSYERQNLKNNGTSVQVINAPFSATGGNQSPGQDYVVFGTGVNFQFTPDFSMQLGYQVQLFRNNMESHFGSVRFGYKF